MIITKPYMRENAVEYARAWALGRNPLFVDFAGYGGDCTNFVSQCILAGSCTMNFTADFGWYYITSTDRTPSWSGVDFFYRFMTGARDFSAVNGGVGPFGSEVRRRFAEIGDVVQPSNSMGRYYHTLIISAIENDEIYVCAHTDDALDRPLSTYNYTAERFIHIEGVREFADEYPCFEDLINGYSLPIPEEYRNGTGQSI
jgi:hypothetical protein